jgi:hypothetical protein
MLFLAVVGLGILTAILAPLIGVALGGRFSYVLMVLVGILAIFGNISVGDAIYSHNNENDVWVTIIMLGFINILFLLCLGALLWAMKKDSR